MQGRTILAFVRGCAGAKSFPVLSAIALLLALSSVERTAAPAPAQTALPSRHLMIRPNLELGHQNSTVVELQGVLTLLGYYQGEVTGRYDEATSLAVARFQTAAQLPPTGRADRATWDALFPPMPAIAAPVAVPPEPKATAVPTPAATPPKPATSVATQPEPYPTLRLGDEGDAVSRLQQRLSKLGLYEGAADGSFGPLTETAVKAAQARFKLEVDGVVGPATWQALWR